jgi:HK97 gp10 family phage protein
MADNEVSQNLEKLAANLSSMLEKAMTNACAVVRNDAVKNAPHSTGALQRSIDFEVSKDGTEGVIFSNLDYAPYVEVGTGIYATKGQGRDTS